MELTEILDWNFAWALQMVSICYLQMMEPIGRDFGKFCKMGYLMGTKTLAITFEPIKISMWGFQGCYCKGPYYWLRVKSNIHTSITFTPILMGHCWMGPKPLKICKLIPSTIPLDTLKHTADIQCPCPPASMSTDGSMYDGVQLHLSVCKIKL